MLGALAVELGFSKLARFSWVQFEARLTGAFSLRPVSSEGGRLGGEDSLTEIITSTQAWRDCFDVG